MTCTLCGSTRTKPITVKPPGRGKKPGQSSHTCTADCEQKALYCEDCKLVRPQN